MASTSATKFIQYFLTRLLCALLFITTKTYSQPMTDTTIIATGATPKLISNQFSFTEGPAVDKMGNVFFTDQPNDKIWKYGTDGKLSLFLDNAGRSNGMYFDKAGNLITCADEHNQLWSINPKGKVTVLLKEYKGRQLNGPNDLWIHPKSGGIYFTDPYYQRKYWTRKSPDIEGQKVYYLSKGVTEAVPLIENMKQPNGIIGTPDGRWLYVADLGAGKTYRYKINDDGSLSDEHLFTSLGSDGMTIDERGNIYLTGNGVTVFNPEGKQVAHIAIPEKWTANVTFGGKARNQLFITASEAIYILEMKVKGVK
ncbi:MAG TPA: SMP-30/gluconolactonase/LRE family protein [Flavisolibacter sp.]|nr:SMP-30/gluconolactonase/LRE family protein [Flavisolibacter sp.]